MKAGPVSTASQHSLHAHLRAETRSAHDRVEAAFGLDRHLASRSAYRTLLERLHGLHRGFETAAASALAGSRLLRPGRSARIARDLRALGADEGRISRLPVAAEMECLCGDLAGALGAAYVVEGSSLGGLVIARQVAERLRLDPEDGASFFAGDGRATAAAWREFCRALDEAGVALDPDRVVAAADATFALVETWLASEPTQSVRQVA